MRRTPLLVLVGLAAACGTPTETTPDRPELAKAPSGPTVTAADPTGATQDTTLDVHVLGSGFDKGTRVAFTRDGVEDPKLHINATQYRTSGELIANVTIAADAQTVPYDVLVTTSSGKKGIGTELFVVETQYEVLSAPAGFSDTYDAGPTGVIAGRVTTSCGPGWAPTLWDQSNTRLILPALSGTCGGVASGVNGTGTAIGSAYIGTGEGPSVRWLPGLAGYTVEQLPALSTGKNAGPWSINESGWISAANDAAIWAEATGWQMLQKPASATSCSFTEVGNGGQVVAACNIGGQALPVFWASPSAAPALLPLPRGATGAHPRGVTPSGVVVGFTTGSGYRAIRWIPSGGAWTIELLPDLGRGGSAAAVDDAGYIAGSVSGPSFARPAYWTPGGELHLLSTGNRAGEALGISEPEGGLIIAGDYTVKAVKIAVRWRP